MMQAPMGLPGALPGAYRITVIAVTCVGGFLMLLSVIIALFSQERRTSFAGILTSLRVPQISPRMKTSANF